MRSTIKYIILPTLGIVLLFWGLFICACHLQYKNCDDKDYDIEYVMHFPDGQTRHHIVHNACRVCQHSSYRGTEQFTYFLHHCNRNNIFFTTHEVRNIWTTGCVELISVRPSTKQ